MCCRRRSGGVVGGGRGVERRRSTHERRSVTQGGLIGRVEIVSIIPEVGGSDS